MSCKSLLTVMEPEELIVAIRKLLNSGFPAAQSGALAFLGKHI